MGLIIFLIICFIFIEKTYKHIIKTMSQSQKNGLIK